MLGLKKPGQVNATAAALLADDEIKERYCSV